MPLRIDDPFAWGEEMGFSDDIMAQLFEQMPQDDLSSNMSFSASVDAEDAFGFGDFAQSVFSNLNPNASLESNLWNVSTGLAGDMGIDLGPIGALNPGGSLLSNAWNVAQWAGHNLDFGEMFGGDTSTPPTPTEKTPATAASDSGMTTLFLPNGDPVEVSNEVLQGKPDPVAPDDAQSQPETRELESAVASLFKRTAGVSADTIAAAEGAVIKKTIARAITALFL